MRLSNFYIAVDPEIDVKRFANSIPRVRVLHDQEGPRERESRPGAWKKQRRKAWQKIWMSEELIWRENWACTSKRGEMLTI